MKMIEKIKFYLLVEFGLKSVQNLAENRKLFVFYNIIQRACEFIILQMLY